MKIEMLKEFDIGKEVDFFGACELNIEKDKKGFLFVTSKEGNIDPCEATMKTTTERVELTMFDADGNKLWDKVMPKTVLPSTWITPFLAFDLNSDGSDEIWCMTNESPWYFNHRDMKLQRIDSRTGENMEKIHFDAENTEWDRMGHAYRFMIGSGYANGEPILLKTQGIYKDIHIQAYNADLSLRWKKTIPVEDGSCNSHTLTVLDINGDGIEEIFFGEHVLNIDTGEELFCFDGDRYHGHSDFVLPFMHEGHMYVYTLRENGDYEGCPRVVMFDADDGHIVWEDIYSDEWGHYVDDAHMHMGWIARLRDDYKKIAFAHRRRAKKGTQEFIIYDVMTGERLEYDFPRPLQIIRPIDLNGDGYTDFFYSADGKVEVYDDQKNLVAEIKGRAWTSGKFLDYEGEQMLVLCGNKAQIWGDADAKDGEIMKMRYENGFLKKNVRKLGSGYNWLSIPNAM